MLDTLSQEEVDRRFFKQVYKRSWMEPVPAGDGGDPSMLASPMILLGFMSGIGFWAGVGWLVFR